MLHLSPIPHYLSLEQCDHQNDVNLRPKEAMPSVSFPACSAAAPGNILVTKAPISPSFSSPAFEPGTLAALCGAAACFTVGFAVVV